MRRNSKINPHDNKISSEIISMLQDLAKTEVPAIGVIRDPAEQKRMEAQHDEIRIRYTFKTLALEGRWPVRMTENNFKYSKGEVISIKPMDIQRFVQAEIAVPLTKEEFKALLLEQYQYERENRLAHGSPGKLAQTLQEIEEMKTTTPTGVL